MKNKAFFLLLIMTLLTACSRGQAAPANISLQATDETVQTQPTTDSVMAATDLSAEQNMSPAATFTPKPPLTEDAWMKMPAVP
jgi:hypothetical protein